MTSFPPFTLFFWCKNTLVYIIKSKLHGGLKIWILFSRGKKTIFYSFAALVRKILFLPLENKIHIFAPPCNILYINHKNIPLSVNLVLLSLPLSLSSSLLLLSFFLVPTYLTLLQDMQNCSQKLFVHYQHFTRKHHPFHDVNRAVSFVFHFSSLTKTKRCTDVLEPQAGIRKLYVSLLMHSDAITSIMTTASYLAFGVGSKSASLHLWLTNVCSLR